MSSSVRFGSRLSESAPACYSRAFPACVTCFACPSGPLSRHACCCGERFLCCVRCLCSVVIFCSVTSLFATCAFTLNVVFSVSLSDWSDDSPEGVSTASPTPPIPKIAIQEDKDDNSEKEWGKVLRGQCNITF